MDSLLDKARSAYKAGEYDEALRCYTDFIKKEPANVQALQDRAQIFFKQGKKDRAHYDLGLASYFKKEFNKAIKEFSNAIIINNHFKEAHCALASAYFAAKNYRNARSELKETLKLDSKIFSAKAMMILTYIGQGSTLISVTGVVLYIGIVLFSNFLISTLLLTVKLSFLGVTAFLSQKVKNKSGILIDLGLSVFIFISYVVSRLVWAIIL